MLDDCGVQLLPQSQFNVGSVEETGLTFVENAILKARHAAQLSQMAAIADDSGLVVDVLSGAPGIYSARFAGRGASDQDNIDKLLSKLEGVSIEQRSARFVCVLVYLRHAEDPSPLICQGAWEGQIATTQSGHGGFGYDPVFYVPEFNQTAAQLGSEKKNKISHRAQAVTQIKKHFLKAE